MILEMQLKQICYSYYKFPIVQWGTGSKIDTGQNYQTINFPISFPNHCFSCYCSSKFINGNIENGDCWYQIVFITKTQVQVIRQSVSPTSQEGYSPIIFAIGN